MAKILDRRRLVPNLHLIEIQAPDVAKKCQPGQFVIVMPDERGERIPLSIADWDPKKGSITSVFLVIGTSTQKLSLLKPGDEVPVFVGPLGKPSEIGNFGTVLLAGGCFGIGALFPIARALKRAGNTVLTLLDAKARYLIYWEDRLRSVSDKLFFATRDFGGATKSYISEDLKKRLESGLKVDRVIAIGCTYLMYTCSMATKPFGVKTTVSLNPIMVDGTGMCGACRVTVGDSTKFVCVDGPEFDGHKVDFDEMMKRLRAYETDEKTSREMHESKHSCQYK
jgi:NAD(P)H-flavin reductase